jgi:hypothetical protein
MIWYCKRPAIKQMNGPQSTHLSISLHSQEIYINSPHWLTYQIYLQYSALHLPRTLPSSPWGESEWERYLGFWLDPGLAIVGHHQKVITKAGTSLQVLRSVSGSTYGASLRAMRRINNQVIILIQCVSNHAHKETEVKRRWGNLYIQISEI